MRKQLMNVTTPCDASSRVKPDEMGLIQAWSGQLTGAESASTDEPTRWSDPVPFSFLCGDRSSREWITQGNAVTESGKGSNGKRTQVLRWRDGETGLTCELELTEFRDVPAIEWVVRLRNDGPAESPPVSSFNALDIVWRCARAGEVPELRRSLGSALG